VNQKQTHYTINAGEVKGLLQKSRKLRVQNCTCQAATMTRKKGGKDIRWSQQFSTKTIVFERDFENTDEFAYK